MIPLVDMHCHLLAGADDGPCTDQEALEMCRIACAEGIRVSAALAHQNDRWSAVTPEFIRDRVQRLSNMLREKDIPLSVFPCAEVMLHEGIEASWQRGDLLSVADRGEYLLVEMPHGCSLDLRETIKGLRRFGVRPILAHPEQSPELLHDSGLIEQFIQAGCLVQVSSGNVIDPPTGRHARILKDWFRRGIVHVLGSDGHSPRRRLPRMARAYRQIARWAGVKVADRTCSTTSLAITYGLPLQVPEPQPQRARWFNGAW